MNSPIEYFTSAASNSTSRFTETPIEVKDLMSDLAISGEANLNEDAKDLEALEEVDREAIYDIFVNN